MILLPNGPSLLLLTLLLASCAATPDTSVSPPDAHSLSTIQPASGPAAVESLTEPDPEPDPTSQLSYRRFTDRMEAAVYQLTASRAYQLWGEPSSTVAEGTRGRVQWDDVYDEDLRPLPTERPTLIVWFDVNGVMTAWTLQLTYKDPNDPSQF